MVTIEEARRLVVESRIALPAVRLPIAQAIGSVLAEDAVAAEDVPPFANTAVDGYAEIGRAHV